MKNKNAAQVDYFLKNKSKLFYSFVKCNQILIYVFSWTRNLAKEYILVINSQEKNSAEK